MSAKKKGQSQNKGSFAGGGLFARKSIIEKLKLNLQFKFLFTLTSFMLTLKQLGKISKKSLYKVRFSLLLETQMHNVFLFFSSFLCLQQFL